MNIASTKHRGGGMSSVFFTTNNLLIGAGALAVAAVGGGILYISIKKPPPDERAILADAAFAQADADAKLAEETTGKLAGEGGFTEAASSNSLCPEDLTATASNAGWLDVCGTGRPPVLAVNPLDGIWEVDAPGNPKIDALTIFMHGNYGILHRGDSNKPSPAHGVWRLKDQELYHGRGFAVRLHVSEDGVVQTGLGQFGYCSCVQLKWRVRPTSDPNMMIGEWSYSDDQRGVSIWRRRSGKAVIRSVIIDAAFKNEQGERVSDQFGYRSRAGRFERRHPVGCGGGMRGNCSALWVTVLGENFAGAHDVWVDPATRFELWEARWVCKNGQTTASAWYKCGVGSVPGDTVAGIQFKFNLWDGIKPGPINIWVDDQPIPVNVMLHGFPGEETEKPQLISLTAFDLENKKLLAFTEGAPFVLEAVYEDDHPDAWVNVEFPLEDNATIAAAGAGQSPDGGADQLNSVTLQRMSDNRTFRSSELAIQSAQSIGD